MLAALAAICGRSSSSGTAYLLRCIHVEHGIRPAEESRGDAVFVQELCHRLKVPCKVVHIPTGRIAEAASCWGAGIEAAARIFRHRIFGAEYHRLGRLYGGDSRTVRLLIAHTRDDLLETLLMRLLSGAGPAGLAAMPARRGKIQRPLLDLDRADVLAYLAARGIAYRTDKTNADNGFFRNRVRNMLAPLLEKEFPQWRKTLFSLAETQRLVADFISAGAESRLRWNSRPSALETPEKTFFEQPEIIREEALFRGIDRLMSGSPVYRRGFRAGRAGIRRFSRGLVRAVDLGPLCIRRGNGSVSICRARKRPFERGFSLLIKRQGSYKLELPSGGQFFVRTGSSAGTECSFSAGLPLLFRPCLPGDRLFSRNLKDVLGFSSGEDCTAAVDRYGLAAIIRLGPEKPQVLLRRDEGSHTQTTIGWSIGGTNAE